ncbi:hypothetical protein ACFVWN_20495 [Nocardiopsis flavescens]|uniref:hypothetical protein n=1 Tax=Nocardiopsis flavescens TaxID=758803 RepID=UPI00365D87F9
MTASADTRAIDALAVPSRGRYTIPTLTVRIRVHSAESRWGSGPFSPVVRPVVLDALCPQCGGLRGEPRNHRQHEDGVWFSVDIWSNPCGHTDTYAAVVEEAARREVVDLDCPVCEHIAPDGGETFGVRGSSRWAHVVLLDHMALHIARGLG